ncbi:MAG TPA: hypothetical protein PLD25_12550 [Chloroflexota bacterium]|nr:hypothetical protein [Chloroflexota bacterium]
MAMSHGIDEKKFDGRALLRYGLLAGVVSAYVAAIGMIATFNQREVIAGYITLGQVLLIAPPLMMAFFAARKMAGQSSGKILAAGAAIGALDILPLLALIFLANNTNIRVMFVNISPQLVSILTFGRESVVVGVLILLMVLLASGVAGSGLALLNPRWRRALVIGLVTALGIALLSELFVVILRERVSNNFARLFFQSGVMRWYTAVGIFLITFGVVLFWQQRGAQVRGRWQQFAAPRQRPVRWGGVSIGGIILLILPWVLGTYLSEVLDNVGLYILMGLGLNIAVGLAGLLDLGYVTNFAVGAYVTAVLTTTSQYGIGPIPFWFVIPIALLAAMFTGFMLALPVLRMRGDYLAIATLGFGEIIRVLVLSDWLATRIGGPQGILALENPAIGGFAFSRPEHFYYIILVACIAMLFVSVRLNNSRTGRQWMALREDEDVAAAMGIDTVLTKLLAFTLSAAAGGVAGAIFAAKLGTVFPQSFNLFVSINVLSIIIIGGMGSIPGIVLGAFLLIGAPELLREFQEYRLLIYGALLIVVMLRRPEGLWPSATRRRELYDAMEATADLGVAHSEVISHGQTAEPPKMD